MKKKITIILAMCALLVCLFAISASASNFVSYTEDQGTLASIGAIVTCNEAPCQFFTMFTDLDCVVWADVDSFNTHVDTLTEKENATYAEYMAAIKVVVDDNSLVSDPAFYITMYKNDDSHYITEEEFNYFYNYEEKTFTAEDVNGVLESIDDYVNECFSDYSTVGRTYNDWLGYNSKYSEYSLTAEQYYEGGVEYSLLDSILIDLVNTWYNYDGLNSKVSEWFENMNSVLEGVSSEDTLEDILERINDYSLASGEFWGEYYSRTIFDVESFKSFYNSTYNTGYSTGYNEGYETCTEDYGSSKEGPEFEESELSPSFWMPEYYCGNCGGSNSGASGAGEACLCFENGYNVGWADAFKSSEAWVLYNDAYNQGYVDGCITKEVTQTVIEYTQEEAVANYMMSESYTSSIVEATERGRTEGKNIGYSEGMSVGYEEGYIAGEKDGLSAGSTEGYSIGLAAGYEAFRNTAEYKNTLLAQYKTGEAEGKSAGYTEGYTIGYYDGYEVMIEDVGADSSDVISVVFIVAFFGILIIAIGIGSHYIFRKKRSR